MEQTSGRIEIKEDFKRNFIVRTKLNIIIFSILFLPLIANANEFTGKVVHVSDGDTITVLRQGKEVKIRLAEIDTPEKKQAFGQKAKQFTANLVAGKIVTIKVKTIDRYGRTVGEVILKNGKSLNRLLVKNGFAWWYSQYSKDKSLGELEELAKNQGLGLWSDKNAIAPWEWRRGKKKRGNEKNYKIIKSPPNLNSPYHCNIRSKICHKPYCKHYNCKNCIQNFNSVEKLKSRGYRLHK